MCMKHFYLFYQVFITCISFFFLKDFIVYLLTKFTLSEYLYSYPFLLGKKSYKQLFSLILLTSFCSYCCLWCGNCKIIHKKRLYIIEKWSTWIVMCIIFHAKKKYEFLSFFYWLSSLSSSIKQSYSHYCLFMIFIMWISLYMCVDLLLHFPFFSRFYLLVLKF